MNIEDLETLILSAAKILHDKDELVRLDDVFVLLNVDLPVDQHYSAITVEHLQIALRNNDIIYIGICAARILRTLSKDACARLYEQIRREFYVF